MMPKKVFISIFIALLLIIGGGFTVLSFSNSKAAPNNKVENDITATSTLTPVPTNTFTPTITPTSALDKTAEDVKDLDKWIFYPVDKTTALDSTFIPKNLVNLSANGISVSSANFEMRKEVITDLKSLFDEAKRAGIYLRVTSPYRSYANQITTFNYWKGLELQKGLSDAQATAEANKSSAMAGHSEHQLGTTCDVISGSDTTLDFTESNKKVWVWMDAHLIEHGFVLSYPQGKDDKTGYVYEPWHIRWVGKDVSKQIENTDYIYPANSNTSTKYLKNLWEKIK